MPLSAVGAKVSDAFFFAYRGTKKKALQKRNAAFLRALP